MRAAVGETLKLQEVRVEVGYITPDRSTCQQVDLPHGVSEKKAWSEDQALKAPPKEETEGGLDLGSKR